MKVESKIGLALASAAFVLSLGCTPQTEYPLQSNGNSLKDNDLPASNTNLESLEFKLLTPPTVGVLRRGGTADLHLIICVQKDTFFTIIAEEIKPDLKWIRQQTILAPGKKCNDEHVLSGFTPGDIEVVRIAQSDQSEGNYTNMRTYQLTNTPGRLDGNFVGLESIDPKEINIGQPPKQKFKFRMPSPFS